MNNQCNVFHALRVAKFLLIVAVCVSAIIVLLSRSAHLDHRPLFILRRTLIIDELCLAKLVPPSNTTYPQRRHCALPLRVAIFRDNSTSISLLLSLHNPLMKIAFIVEDNPSKDFWLFNESIGKNSTNRVALKKFPTQPVIVPLGPFDYEFEIPANLDHFKRNWHNGRYIQCEVLLKRNETELNRFLPLSMIDRAAELVAHMDQFNVTGILFGGTLLGWRRECSLIPHTGDIDIGLFAGEHSPALLDSLIHSEKFLLKWILGHPRDSLESTLWMDNFKTDLFYLYYNSTRGQSYMNGMRVEKRQQARWFYPPIVELCTGEMRDHLFHLPCNHDSIIEAEYGKDEWKADFPTSQFFWDKSHKNMESGEVYDEEVWKPLFNVYYPKAEHNQTLPQWN